MSSAAFAADIAAFATRTAAEITPDCPAEMPEAMPEEMAVPMLRALAVAADAWAARAADRALMRLFAAAALSPAKLYCVMPKPTPAETSLPRGTMRCAGDWLWSESRYAPSKFPPAVSVSPEKS